MKFLFPRVLEDLILDYAWSHHMFMLKVDMHAQLQKLKMLEEMRLFYSVFTTITTEMTAVPEPEEVNG